TQQVAVWRLTVTREGLEDAGYVERREVYVEQQQRLQAGQVKGEQGVQRLPSVAETHEAVAAGAQAVLEPPRQGRVVFHTDHFGRARPRTGRGGSGRSRPGRWRVGRSRGA